MKRSDIIDLIRAHSEHDDLAFNNAATIIAKDFETSGQPELASYIMALIARTRTFVPQEVTEQKYDFLEKVISNNASLPLPRPSLMISKGCSMLYLKMWTSTPSSFTAHREPAKPKLQNR